MHSPTQNDHPIHDLLQKRWSPRAFADKPVEEAKLRSLFEAARWAPSSYNEQPWGFLVATKANPVEYQRLLECLIEFNQSWAGKAPVLILPVARLTFEKNGKENRHALHDVGLAVGALVTQATHEGLVAHQMAGILIDKARETFGIPQGWEAVTAIAIGYEGDPDSLPDGLKERELAPRTRKALASMVFTGAFGKTSPLVG